LNNKLAKQLKDLEMFEIFPKGLENTFNIFICGAIPSICSNVFTLVADKNPSTLNSSRFDVIFGHYPSSSSLKTLNYW